MYECLAHGALHMGGTQCVSNLFLINETGIDHWQISTHSKAELLKLGIY